MPNTIFKSKINRFLAAFVLSTFLAVGGLQPASVEAVKIGTIGTVVGVAAQQAEVRKALDYYDNAGRDELFEELKREDGVDPDPQRNAILNSIMGRLSPAIAQNDSSIVEKPYNYFINNYDYFNAYCTLGHNISINRGVFNFFDNNEDKVAAVVAHEMVHGQKNHALNGAKKKMTVDFIQKTIGAEIGGGAAGLAVDVVAVHAKNTGITKPNEWEADNIAFTYLADAGYNIGAPAAVWQRVIDNSDATGSKNFFGDLFSPSTHPANKDRRDNYAKKLTEYSKKKVEVDANSGEVKVNGKLFMKPTEFANMSGLERAYLVAGNLAEVYSKGNEADNVVAEGSLVKFGAKNIVQTGPNDESASVLAERLNSIK